MKAQIFIRFLEFWIKQVSECSGMIGIGQSVGHNSLESFAMVR